MKKAMVIKKDSQEKMFCNYIHRFCNQPRLDCYNYCIRHILEDKSAPFRQCSFVHPQNRKRCNNAAAKNEKRDSLCPWHSKRAVLGSKTVSTVKRTIVEGPASVLSEFEHYCQDKNHNPTYKQSAAEKEKRETLILDSSGQSDLKTLGSTSGNNSVDQSYIVNVEDESEDIDSEHEDYLKHAGVYTTEEAVKITKDKIFRLQSLYMDQLKRLQDMLCEKRRKYLHELNVEQETYGNIILSKVFTHEKEYCEQLSALKKYHSHFGNDALLHHQSLKARNVALPHKEQLTMSKQTFCTYSSKGRKCYQKAVVFTKFCFKHILSDPNQMIYKPCSGDGKSICNRPVIDHTENPSCSLHTQLEPKLKAKKVEFKEEISAMETDSLLEPEHFQSMDDIASLGLDVVTPGCLFGLDQFGEPGESTDTVLSEDQADLMQIQPITLNPPDNILCDSRKSESDEEK